MEKRQRHARIIAVSLFISLFFLWGGGYNTAPIFLAALLKAFASSSGEILSAKIEARIDRGPWEKSERKLKAKAGGRRGHTAFGAATEIVVIPSSS